MSYLKIKTEKDVRLGSLITHCKSYQNYEANNGGPTFFIECQGGTENVSACLLASKKLF